MNLRTSRKPVARPKARRHRLQRFGVLGGCTGLFLAFIAPLTSGVASATPSLGDATVLATLGGAPSLATAPQTSLPFTLGYWKKQGLNVSLQELGSGTTDAQALSLIATNSTLMTAPVAPTSLMAAELKGLPVTGVYVYLRQGLNSIYVLQNSPITKMSQLDGKNIGTYTAGPSGGPYDEAKIMLEENGATASSISINNIGYSPATIQPLQSGADAAYVVTEADYFDSIGTAMRKLPDKTFSKRFGFVFAVNTGILKSHPKAVVALMKGFAEATLFAETNRTAAIRVHWATFPDSKPVNVSDSQALASALVAVQHRFDKYVVPKGQMFGLLPNQHTKWETMESEAIVGSEIPARIPVDKLFTSSLISSINNFNKAAIIKQAKTYK